MDEMKYLWNLIRDIKTTEDMRNAKHEIVVARSLNSIDTETKNEMLMAVQCKILELGLF